MIGITEELRRPKSAEQNQPGSAGGAGGIRAKSSPTDFTTFPLAQRRTANVDGATGKEGR